MSTGDSAAEDCTERDTTSEISQSPADSAPLTIPDALRAAIQTWTTSSNRADVHARTNLIRVLLSEVDDLPHPVGAVQWVPIGKVVSNTYNPNTVPRNEMRLLHTSIANDGYTQPVVTVRDDDNDRWVVVDGFHRMTVMKTQSDIHASTGGYLPIVVIDKPLADRVASTVRHNRARGKHSVKGMSNLVFKMLDEGETDEAICNKVGLEAEELARLKYITGFAKLYADREYSKPTLTERQVRAKAAYRREHPDEPIPTNI